MGAISFKLHLRNTRVKTNNRIPYYFKKRNYAELQLTRYTVTIL